MPTVSAFDARTRFGKMLNRVANGEEIVITRYDEPVAQLVRAGAPRLEEVRRAVAGPKALQRQIAARGRGRARPGGDDRHPRHGESVRLYAQARHPAIVPHIAGDDRHAVGQSGRRNPEVVRGD